MGTEHHYKAETHRGGGSSRGTKGRAIKTIRTKYKQKTTDEQGNGNHGQVHNIQKS